MVGNYVRLRLTLPLVMRLVQALVEEGKVQPPMNPVDAPIRRGHEGDHAESKIRPMAVTLEHGSLEPSSSVLLQRIVQQRCTTDLPNEPRNDQSSHARHGLHRHDDLLSNLILEESRMVFQTTVEQEKVGQCRYRPVEEERTGICHPEE